MRAIFDDLNACCIRNLYEFIHVRDVTAPEELEKLEIIRLAQQDRPRGIGRPTKRDRRDWEKAFRT